ncbi:hypothetical protein T439DRAFT_326918 [Meredithblackwellia eburnea MCA 4105]
MSFKGSCYCGEIEVQLDEDEKAVLGGGILCHCRTCQKLHTENSYNLQSEESKFKVTKGTPKMYSDRKTDSGKAIHRYFCGNCGSALYSIPELIPGAIFVKVGALDRAGEIVPKAQIYVDTGMNHSILDKKQYGVACYEGMMAKEV